MRNKFWLGVAVGAILTAVPLALAKSAPAEERSPVFQILTERYNVPHHSAAILSMVVEDAATQYDLPVEILLAQIQVESSYYSQARSRAGAVGLMQVRPRFWTDACYPYDPYDKWENIYVGACALSHYRNSLGNVPDALVAYNIGITAYKNGESLDAGTRYMFKVVDEAAIIYSKY